MKKMKQFAIPALTILLAAVSLSSCKKSDSGYYNDLSDNIAAVSVVNGAPLTMPLDIKFNGTNRFYLENFNYTYRLNYTQVSPGNRKLYVYNRGKADSLFAKDLTLEAKKNYSIFIVDTLSHMDAVLVRDSTRAATGDSVRIRFANMSPDAGALDLYIKGNTTPVATNISYKNVNQFQSLKAGKDLIFEVRPAGSATVLASSDAMNLFANSIYTIWTTGFKSMSTTNGKLLVEGMRH